MKQKYLRLLTVPIAVLSLGLAACGSTSSSAPSTVKSTSMSSSVASVPTTSKQTPKPTPVTTPPRTSTSTSSSSMTSTPTESSDDYTSSNSPSALETAIGGADAAPGGSSATSFYDNTQQAKTNFINWWVYEVQVVEDQVDFEKAYTDGIAACYSRSIGVGTDAILTVLSRDAGYSVSGANGIYKSALEALCTKYNIGFKTAFDRYVERFMAELRPRITYAKGEWPFYEYGRFLKTTCEAMVAPGIGGAGVYDYMRSRTDLVLTENGTIPQGVLDIFINQAVSAGCYPVYTQLPPRIQMS